MTEEEKIEGIPVVRLDETTSTHDVARALAEDSRSRGPLLVVARHQRAGRGRGDNRWLSSPGDDLLCTLLWYPATLAAADQFVLSMAAALAVSRMIGTFARQTAIKWPNDILAGGRKIAGILIEHTIKNNRIEKTLIGTGINIHETSFPSSLPHATSLRMITGRNYDIGDLTGILLRHLTENLRRAEETGGAEELRSAYTAQLYLRGRESRFRTPAGEITATLTGVDRWGRLQLTTPEGLTHTYGMEEVHQAL